MKRSLVLGLVLVFAGPALVLARTGSNLLLITIDTLRPDRLSCYDSRFVKTPNIDSLAASGVVFDRAFSHVPLTLPAHTDILLGTTPLAHGVHDNGIFKVSDKLPTLAVYLKQNGYATGAFVGSFPLDSRFGLTQGFDVYDDNYGSVEALSFRYVERKAELVVESALAWLKDQPSPWFLWIHVFDPHQPYEPPEPYKTQFKGDLYSGEVAYVDASLAKLFSYLRNSGQSDSTLTVLTADHGQGLGEHDEATHGYFAYNSTLWVPLIIAGPGLKPGRVEQNACHTDIFPTVCDLLGLDKPGYLQGVSLLPAIRGKELAARSIYFESLYPYYRRGWGPIRGFIRGSEKFVDSPIPEVYDLKADFNETKNLAGKDLDQEREEMGKLIKSESASGGTKPNPRLDAEAQRKLESLGYVGGYQPQIKEKFGPEDDLKTLRPFNRKFDEVLALYMRGQKEECIKVLRELIGQRPDFDSAYIFLVTVFEEQKKMAEAEAVLKKGTTENPRSYKLAVEYGIILAEGGRNDEAIRVLNKASGLIDWDPELWNYLGVAYWNKGDLEHALAAYDKALGLDPEYAVVLNNLGSVTFVQAKKNKDSAALRLASEYFRRAVTADPRFSSAYNGLGAVYRTMGDLDSAIFCWGKALEISPNHRFALYNLGTAYLDRGDKKKALTYLTQYKEHYYSILPAAEKASLDADLAKCRQGHPESVKPPEIDRPTPVQSS